MEPRSLEVRVPSSPQPRFLVTKTHDYSVLSLASSPTRSGANGYRLRALTERAISDSLSITILVRYWNATKKDEKFS